jgi:hypothetical protein
MVIVNPNLRKLVFRHDFLATLDYNGNNVQDADDQSIQCLCLCYFIT